MVQSHVQFLSLLLTTTPLILSQGLLELRNPYYGGYALPGTPELGAVHGCPAGTLTCSNEVFVHCCPNYTFCGPYQPGAYCCPTADDCGSVLGAGATCANPEWTLYEDAFIWCCENDSVGLALSDGECQPISISYSSSFYARTLVQANDAPPPSSWIGGVPTGLSTANTGTAMSSPTAAGTKSSPGTQAAGSSSTGSVSPAATTKNSAASAVGMGKGKWNVVAGVISVVLFGSTLAVAVLL